ncbi:small cell adhesion glycoprotein homolog [Micropterus dolomieu]|uniref:small cell adhesion glycoprotein homolog n=1 Tax=Micropterus dolomieu TaxID=147949 RepID=UPI001E8E7404|nr:small cell adhesion glycoprotein homolog [Micropterus dolomieu]
MDGYTTPPPGDVSSSSPLPEVVTKGNYTDDGPVAALIGGIVSAVLLLLICMIAVLLWCLSRHKGSYVTNEMDEDEDEDDVDGHDDESVGSDTALQSKEPLKIKEEE